MRESAFDNCMAREVSTWRADELTNDAEYYTSQAATVYTGFDRQPQIEEQKQKILYLLGAGEEDWVDWKWQLRHRISDASLLGKALDLSQTEIKQIVRVGKHFRWAISPYYLSLIDAHYLDSPIYRQAVPDIRELLPGGSMDPMQEQFTSPETCITRRYPDRLIINVTNQCAMFCRHCQRRRNIGEQDTYSSPHDIQEALNYVADHHEIRDVLVTGGDALLLSDRNLDRILKTLYNLPHVEIVRLGTRTPVTLPQRITEDLCDILRCYPPIYINTQFNHPMEITPEAKQACDRLVAAGVVLGNQAVLLKGINDDPITMRKLNHELLKIRVRPYYLFQAKEVTGTAHWQCSIEKGMQIMDSMRGHTSGLAIPTYVLNAPNGLGKIPLMPNYLLSHDQKEYYLQTWEGRVVRVKEPS